MLWGDPSGNIRRMAGEQQILATTTPECTPDEYRTLCEGMTPLIQLGNFTLNSGKPSEFKLVADEFIRVNLDGLVHLIRKAVGPYGDVAGIPRGGCLLADALVKYNAVELPQTLLIVDDVLTTGGSMRRAREWNAGKYEYIVGAVVFSRGRCPSWITPLLQMPESLFLKG